MKNYIEKEIKVLDVDVEVLQKSLEKIGATKVFDDTRVFTTFDTKDRMYTSNNKIIRLTEEEKLKLSVNFTKESGEKSAVKVFTSRKEETVDFLSQLDVFPIACVKSHRISYELGDVDFDIDIFPEIPPFLEIDIECLQIPVGELLRKLGLEGNDVVEMGTEKIFEKYGKDYYTLFKV